MSYGKRIKDLYLPRRLYLFSNHAITPILHYKPKVIIRRLYKAELYDGRF